MQWLIKIITTLLLVISVGQISAQVFYTDDELGVSIGVSSYFGDLNPDYNLLHARPALGIFYKNHLHPYISVRAALNYTQLGFDDQWSKNEFQQIRNLSFETPLIEFSALAEFNFFYFSTGQQGKRFTPYLLLGVAGFYYNPYTYLDGKKYYLQPIGTEGQKKNEYKDRAYSKFSLAIPAGVGIKYWIRPGLNLSVDLLHRFTFTDYLDDVSQTYVDFSNGNSRDRRLADPSENKIGYAGKKRGDSASFDEYLMFQVSISLQFKTYKCPKSWNQSYF